MKIIFDLDGTLALIDHRRHLVEGPGPKNWDAFFEACDRDDPNIPVINVLHALHAQGHSIAVWSGRSRQVVAKTRVWLDLHVGIRSITDTLRMRDEGDFQPDVDLKMGWLEQLIVPPDLVFDDRQSVVDAWRAKGITCFQVAPGKF